MNWPITGYEPSLSKVVKTEKSSLYSNVYSLLSGSTNKQKTTFFLAYLKSWDIVLTISDGDPVRRKQKILWRKWTKK